MRSQGKAAAARDDLRRRITSGEYAPGDRIPGVRDLMKHYNFRSASGLDRALGELVAEGLLIRRHGNGMYVRTRHVIRRDLLANLRLEHQRVHSAEPASDSLFEAMTGAEGLDVEADYRHCEAPPRVAELLKLPAAAPVLERTFSFTIGGTPHQTAISYMAAEVALRARLLSRESEKVGEGTLAQLHRVGIAVDRVEWTIEGRPPTAEEVEELAMLPGTHVFEHWRLMLAGGEPVEVTTMAVPQDRVSYRFNLDFEALW